MKGKELGGKVHLGLHWQTFCTVTQPKMQPKFSDLHLPTLAGLNMKESWYQRSRLWGPSGHCSAQIIIYRCQGQLQISHMQPEVFMQEPSNFGFDQKPQIGVNISLATFYDIYILHASSRADDSNVCCRHLPWSHPHVRVQVEKQLKEGRENDTAKVSPKREGVSSLCIQAKPLSLPLGSEYLPTVSKSCIYQVTAPKECIFSFSWRREGRGRLGLKPQLIWESLQADLEIF